MKLKGIDGGPHKQRSMWFNSTQREEPYQGLTLSARHRDMAFPSGTRKQVVHGCRQLVSCDVGLSPATSATPILCFQRIKPGTHRRLPRTTWRKAGMTSSHHAPYVLGYTRTTMVGNRGKRSREAEQTPETRSQFGLQAATRLHEVGIASNRRSAYCGEYVPGPCTRRPSHHESW